MANKTAAPMPLRIRAEMFLKLAQLERAGIPYDRAAQALDLPEKYQSRIQSLQAFAAKGVDPATAGEKSGVFTRMEARMVRATSLTGSPEATYKRLATHYDLRAAQLSKMRANLALPGFLLVASLLIQPLPALIGGSLTVQGYLWQAIRPWLVIVAGWLIVKQLAGSESTSIAKNWQQFVPIWRKVFVKRNLRDFFENLALMLQAGLSMLDALPAALDTIEDGDMRHELTKVRQRVERGATFADALRGLRYVGDGRAVQFAQTGESSGTLDEMLRRHADMETEELDTTYKEISSWLPRIIYAIIAISIMFNLIGGGSVHKRIVT